MFIHLSVSAIENIRVFIKDRSTRTCKRNIIANYPNHWQNKVLHVSCKPRTAVYLPQTKGTVSVISSDPPCKDDNVRFTTAP